jgi:transcription elongation factor GreA
VSTDAEMITAEGLAALREELAQLEGSGRREIAARIGAAADLGDLKENADYHIAKEDQAHLETKIKRLTERLRRAQVADAPTGGDEVAFGATVTVLDVASGKPATYKIVGPTEADLRAGKLSAESPMAKALMGKKVGDTVSLVTPRGTRDVRVEKLGA